MDPEQAPAAGERPLRVAIADDSPLLIDGVARALGDGSAVTVVARATSGTELLAKAEGRDPDVVVIEPWMSSGDGLDAIASLRQQKPGTTVVALSGVQQGEYVEQALAAGAAGYVGKDVPPADLLPLVRRVRSGVLVRPRAEPADGPVHALTHREREVLALVSQGLSNHEVGDRLFVTEQTVKFHLGNIYRKLGAHNRTEAARRALSLGLAR